ncbi:MAG: PEP-utilizing enzyme [Candidatus Diapherotrites archaeon]
MDLEQVLDLDRKVDWEVFLTRHGEYPLLWSYLVIDCQHPAERLENLTSFRFEFENFKKIGESYYWSPADYKRIRNDLGELGSQNPSAFTEINRRLRHHSEELIRKAKEIGGRKNIRGMDKQALRYLFDYYWQALVDSVSFIQLKHNFNRVLESLVSEKLLELLKSRGMETEFDRYLDKVVFPSDDSLVVLESRKILEIAVMVKNDEKLIKVFEENEKEIEAKIREKFSEISHELDFLVKEYGWSTRFTWAREAMSAEDYIARIKKAVGQDCEKKLSDLEENKATRNKDFNAIVKELGVDGELLVYMEALQELLYLHTFQLEASFAAEYYALNLVEEICRLFDITIQEFHFFIKPEIDSFFDGAEIDKNLAHQRLEWYGIFLFNRKMSVFSADDREAIERATKKEVEEIETISGSIANKGKVVGTVKIIKTKQDGVKFNRGDILVAPMTTIDLTEIIEKAGAIVTDEGGITCHAAIVSREFGIPGIIGTKNATSLLKDGDMVEVDAFKGVVRRI